MKAIYCDHYADPPELELREVPIPNPKETEVRIRVMACPVNDYDWSMARGKPGIYRLFFGLRRPKRPVLGMEVAGVVEEVGTEVTRFKVGDVVYGDTSDHGLGTMAEYCCVHEDDLRHKPEEMSFTDAAAIPHASLLAWQGLQLAGGAEHGQRILVNGAGGGVGAYLAQMLRGLDMELTGVDSQEKFEHMSALGYDHLIDYRTQDFSRMGKTYDVILDAKSDKTPKDYIRSLSPGGRFVTVGGTVPALLRILVWSRFRNRRSDRKLHILALKANQGLDHIEELYAQGKLVPSIDGPYPLEQAPRLISYFGRAEHHGKVVIELDDLDHG